MAADPFVRFTLPDRRRRFRDVRLYQELQRPYDGPAMAYEPIHHRWVVDLATRGAVRVEYLFNIQHADGAWSMGPDPDAPVRAPGPFGEKSVIELPGYRPPAWLAADAPAGAIEPLEVESRRLGYAVRVLLWTPSTYAADDLLPLLLVLDGPELAEYASLLHLLAQHRPVHVGLVAPAARHDEYSASVAFARALESEIVPAIAARRAVPTGRQGRAALGVSLGALALLHAQRAHPHLFGALFLQSGSYFQRRTDPQEAGFGRYVRITRFVGSVLREGRASIPATPCRVVMTCGSVEENLANNRSMRDALAAQGYCVDWIEHPDGHNWVSWRDVLDPALPSLLDELEP